MGSKRKKTRKINGKNDFFCSMHATAVVDRARFYTDDDGKRRFGGNYLACKDYYECGYYVSIENDADPLVDADGRAVGRAG